MLQESPRSDTAMGAAFIAAKAKSKRSLEDLAKDLLRKASNNPIVAHDSVCDAVFGDVRVMLELLAAEFQIGDRDLRDAALRYLRRLTGAKTASAPGSTLHGRVVSMVQDGMSGAATRERIVADAETDQDLKAALVGRGAFDVARQATADIRRKAWGSLNNKADQHGDRVLALSRGNLLSFILPAGRALGECLKEEVDGAVGWYRLRQRDGAVKLAWLELVSGKLKSGQKVSDHLTSEQLAELQDQANAA